MGGAISAFTRVFTRYAISRLREIGSRDTHHINPLHRS
jgi:hypothetical protein